MHAHAIFSLAHFHVYMLMLVQIRMHVCIGESFPFWDTLPSKRCPASIHAGQRFDGRVSQNLNFRLTSFKFC